MTERNLPADLTELHANMATLGLYAGPSGGSWSSASFDGLKRALAAYAGLQQLSSGLRITSQLRPEVRTGPVVDVNVSLEVAHHEAMVRQAYHNPGDRWTWSVGLTSATGHKVERYIDNRQTLQFCIDIYVWALKRYSEQVVKVFAGHEISQAVFAGAVSFHWNTGGIREAKWPKLYMAGNHERAEEAFLLWNQSGGKINNVLTRRRAAEADLIWRGIWLNRGTMTEVARLTGDHRPDWSSAITIDVSTEMERAFAYDPQPALDVEPQPLAVPAAPTLSVQR